MSRRWSVLGAVVTLAVLLHLAAGIAGPGMQLCVCTTGVTSAPPRTACCSDAPAPTDSDASDHVPGGCPGCCLLPLPGNPAAVVRPAPSLPLMAVLPASVQVWSIVWPEPPKPSFGRPRGDPPDPVPRHLRTVILTC